MSLHHPAQNHLLAALPSPELDRLRPELGLVPMPLGWVVHEAGRRQDYVYFPTGSIVSLLYVMENGASAKIAIAGDEGFVGIASAMGGDTTTSRAVVQSSGYAYRLGAEALQREFRRGGRLRHIALNYTQALIAQMTQIAVCHRHHSMEQQLCRWLLLSADRLKSPELVFNLDLMVGILGTPRQGIVHAVARLQALGVIRFGRGRIGVIDRAGLEAVACECHAVVADEYDRLLGTRYGARRPPRVAAAAREIAGVAVS